MARHTQHDQMPLFLNAVAEQISTRSEGVHKQRCQVDMETFHRWMSSQRAAALVLTSCGDNSSARHTCVRSH
jgi:hypothetical protein